MTSKKGPKVTLTVPPAPAEKKEAPVAAAKERIKRKARRERARESKEVTSDVQKRLGSHQETVRKFLTNRGDYKGSWRQWTKEFGAAIGLEGKSFTTVRSYVKALQRIVFNKLDLGQDRRAIADGKVGKYTVVALASYMGWNHSVSHQEMVDAGLKKTGRLQAENASAGNEYKRKTDKVFTAYLGVLGTRRITRRTFNELSPHLMPLIDMSKIKNKNYLLGQLYVLALRGVAADSYRRYLTQLEKSRAQEYAETYLGVGGLPKADDVA